MKAQQGDYEFYFFTMTQCSFRSGERIGKVVGIVLAYSEDEAMDKAWVLAGNDAACKLTVEKIDVRQGYKFTVYKSEI